MNSTFHYGHGRVGYEVLVEGDVSDRDVYSLKAFLYKVGWRPAKGEEARMVAFFLPVGVSKAWIGHVWDAGLDSFGRSNSVAAEGRLLGRAEALRTLGLSSGSKEVMEAIGQGQAIVIGEHDRLHLPATALRLGSVD